MKGEERERFFELKRAEQRGVFGGRMRVVTGGTHIVIHRERIMGVESGKKWERRLLQRKETVDSLFGVRTPISREVGAGEGMRQQGSVMGGGRK